MMDPKVDKYIRSAKRWQAEMSALQEILLSCPLTEEIKWGKPCYAHEGSNIVLIQDFKSYLALLFFKGVLLKDPKKILQKTGENTRIGRQLRFSHVHEIQKLKSTLKSYIKEAIAVEKSGEKVKVKSPALKFPAELQEQFATDPALKKAFEALTPGRQRAYIINLSSAKQSATRLARIKKYRVQILKGKGLNEL